MPFIQVYKIILFSPNTETLSYALINQTEMTNEHKKTQFYFSCMFKFTLHNIPCLDQLCHHPNDFSLCNDSYHSPSTPVKVFTTHYLYKKAEERSYCSTGIDVTAFALSCHLIAPPRVQWLTTWGAPITLEGEAAAMAGSGEAFYSIPPRTPNAAYDIFAGVDTWVVCHK